MKYLALLFISSIMLLNCQKQEPQWESIFNGKDLSGWDIKVSGYPMNENPKNYFQVIDSSIVANYAEFDTFTHEYGHLYYHIPYSYYKLKMKYRIFGEHVPGVPDYAYNNSGVMLHSQSAAEQELDQNFPISIEMQFLSALDANPRASGNLASPGTHVMVNGKLHTDHMLYCNGATYGDEWVDAEAVVLGDSVVYHIINGDTVLTYNKPIIGGWEKDNEVGWIKDKTWVKKMVNTPLKKGYIALQAEGQPVEFKDIQIMDLSSLYSKDK